MAASAGKNISGQNHKNGSGYPSLFCTLATPPYAPSYILHRTARHDLPSRKDHGRNTLENPGLHVGAFPIGHRRATLRLG
jgi:hypothetical protein